MRSMSPHARAAVYKNRIVGAVWLSILVGVLTVVEPYFRLGQATEFFPGLLFPGALAKLVGVAAGATPHVLVALLCGGVLIILAILGGRGRRNALLGAVLVIAVDWPIVLTQGSASSFPVLATSVLRLFYLYTIVRGYLAVASRTALLERMTKADQEYDEELKERSRRRGGKGDKPVDSRFESEDDYQG